MTIKAWFLLAVLSINYGHLKAQENNGNANVEKLCGCFSVNYKYAETFSPDVNYKFHDREEMSATELVIPLEKSDKKLVLQHLLLVADTIVIKHWREEWTYEPTAEFVFKGDKVWEKKALSPEEAKGKWIQTIWEVNDEPRYQGLSAWINNDQSLFWESTTDAPLPRREYSTRNDYNILKRRNRIVLTADGYMHEQDNDKILRKDGKDKLIAQEKGYNTYYRLDNNDCAVAAEWWKKNGTFWSVVRDQWQEFIAKSTVVAIKPKVDDKRLDEYFTALYKDWSGKKINDKELAGKVREVLQQFL